MKEIYIFQHIVTKQLYCWNGLYPVKLLGPRGENWHPEGIITGKEFETFNSLLGTRKKAFELKGRGKFEVIHRIKIYKDPSDLLGK